MHERIKRFTKQALSTEDKQRKRRLHEFKRLILNMPYTSTHYHFKKNPGEFFRQEEQELATGRTTSSPAIQEWLKDTSAEPYMN